MICDLLSFVTMDLDGGSDDLVADWVGRMLHESHCTSRKTATYGAGGEASSSFPYVNYVNFGGCVNLNQSSPPYC
jgi:hypothetical protein